MSIIHTFDDSSEAIINPSNIIQYNENLPKTIIGIFSDKFMRKLLSTYPTEIVATLHAGIPIPIYKFTYHGKELGMFQSLICGAVASGLLEELIAMGAEKFLYFGSAGSLNEELTSGHFVVPTEAYRDEGASYHYAPASDYIKVASADRLSDLLTQLDVPHIKARVWTTDSMYRETKKNMLLRKQDGCVAVDMECASLMAVADFRKVEVYEFVYTADCLDGAQWDRRILGNMPEDMRDTIFQIALQIADKL